MLQRFREKVGNLRRKRLPLYFLLAVMVIILLYNRYSLRKLVYSSGVVSERNDGDLPHGKHRLPQDLDDDKQMVDLRVIILTFDRFGSLGRLLNSLNETEYDKDRVVIEIWIDGMKSNVVHGRTLQTAKEFVFNKGLCKEEELNYSGKDRRTQAEEEENLLQEWTLELKDLPDDPLYLDNKGLFVK